MNRILIVDDHEENLLYLKSLLTSRDCIAEVARHGAEALLKARHSPPDLIVSDLLMPVMDGYTLLRHWKADARLKAIPFIVYTATYTDKADERLALSLGADAFMLKPSEPEDFLARIREVQSKAEAAEPALSLAKLPIEDQEGLLKTYNETLIRKLEEKTLQLEESNRALREDVVARVNAEQAQRRMADRQMAILNALTAHIALVDAEGVIVSVNAAWRRFATANVLQGPDFCVGQNYLTVCEQATGGCSAEAKLAAAGIRGVLAGEAKEFSIEYPCHSPTEPRWFRMMATPLRDDERAGAVIMHVNITARKLSENAVHEIKQRLELATASANIGIWDWDVVEDKMTWDQQMRAFYGIGESDFSGAYDAWQKGIHPDDRERAEAEIKVALAGARDFHTEFRVRRPDGEVRHIEAHGLVRRAEDGSPTRMIGVNWDISERKRIEDRLRKSEQEFRTLAESVPQVIWVTRADGWNIYFNQRWMDYTGLTLEESLGHGWNKPFHPDDQQRAWNAWQHATKTIGAYSLECRLRRADGVYRWWLIRGRPLRDETGQIFKWFGTCTDIDDIQRAEARIREQAALIDEASDAIVVRDLDHRITFWSKGAERIYGWTFPEVQGRSLPELLQADNEIFAQADRATREVGHWKGEIQKRTKKGGSITVDCRWTLLRDDLGKPRSILSIDTDITERKKLEQQFLRAQRMESIGTLAGGIAHDLNNVFAPIIMSLELLEMEYPGSSGQEMLATVRSSAQHGADMVRQVLSFARGVEGRRVEVQVGHLLRDIEKIARDTFLKTIQVRTIAPRTLRTLLGDPTQIHQMLLNLCVNARDAMPNGGALNVSAENVSLDEQYAVLNPEAKPGPYILITVEDTGTGIPPEIIDKIFDPFFTTKQVGKGTGLGLSTSQAIIKSHGGFLRVHSEPGKGTKFEIFLPSQSGASPETDARIETDLPRGKGELILVVDDEASVRQVMQQTLNAFGYRVVLACDGAEAIAIFAKQGAEIDVVLTDMTMPVMDGRATIQVLRRMDPKMPIIAASGLSASPQLAQATSLGVEHFLSKPYTTETLLKVLREVLATER